MQPQYSQGAAPSHHPPPYAPPEVSQTSGGSITSSLRQWRKKDFVEKQQSADVSSTAVADNPSHVARVAPHTYYPRPTNEVCHYQHQYAEYGVPYKPPPPAPVKYSEIVDNQQGQTLEHITQVPPKHKDKEYADLCSVQPQPHLKQYQDHMSLKQPYPDGAKQTYSDSTIHHQYMSKESQMQSFLQKQPQMHQYIQKEPYQQQYMPKYTMQAQYPQSYSSEPNKFLMHLSKIHPRMAQSIINDTHLRESQIPMYNGVDQGRPPYPQPQRMYHAPSLHSTHRNIPQGYNYPQPYNYNMKPPTMQPNDPYNRMPQYQHNIPKYLPDYKINSPIEPNISPQHVYGENIHMNYAPMPPKISPNYPHCGQLEYAQHYQHRRAQLAQEYYPHSGYKSGYVQNPQVSPEGGPGAETRARKSSLKQYLETWVEEDMSGNLPDIIVSNNLNDVESVDGLKGTVCVKGRDTQEQPLYVLDTTEIANENLPQFLHLQQVEKLPDNVRGYYHAANAVPSGSRRLVVDNNNSEDFPESGQGLRGNPESIVSKIPDVFASENGVGTGDTVINQSVTDIQRRISLNEEQAEKKRVQAIDNQFQNADDKVVQIHIIEDCEGAANSSSPILDIHKGSLSDDSDRVIMQSTMYQQIVPPPPSDNLPEVITTTDENLVVNKTVRVEKGTESPDESDFQPELNEGAVIHMPVIDDCSGETSKNAEANLSHETDAGVPNESAIEETEEEPNENALVASGGNLGLNIIGSISNIYKEMELIHGDHLEGKLKNSVEDSQHLEDVPCNLSQKDSKASSRRSSNCSDIGESSIVKLDEGEPSEELNTIDKHSELNPQSPVKVLNKTYFMQADEFVTFDGSSGTDLTNHLSKDEAETETAANNIKYCASKEFPETKETFCHMSKKLLEDSHETKQLHSHNTLMEQETQFLSNKTTEENLVIPQPTSSCNEMMLHNMTEDNMLDKNVKSPERVNNSTVKTILQIPNAKSIMSRNCANQTNNENLPINNFEPDISEETSKGESDYFKDSSDLSVNADDDEDDSFNNECIEHPSADFSPNVITTALETTEDIATTLQSENKINIQLEHNFEHVREQPLTDFVSNLSESMPSVFSDESSTEPSPLVPKTTDETEWQSLNSDYDENAKNYTQTVKPLNLSMYKKYIGGPEPPIVFEKFADTSTTPIKDHKLTEDECISDIDNTADIESPELQIEKTTEPNNLSENTRDQEDITKSNWQSDLTVIDALEDTMPVLERMENQDEADHRTELIHCNLAFSDDAESKSETRRTIPRLTPETKIVKSGRRKRSKEKLSHKEHESGSVGVRRKCRRLNKPLSKLHRKKDKHKSSKLPVHQEYYDEVIDGKSPDVVESIAEAAAEKCLEDGLQNNIIAEKELLFQPEQRFLEEDICTQNPTPETATFENLNEENQDDQCKQIDDDPQGEEFPDQESHVSEDAETNNSDKQTDIADELALEETETSALESGEENCENRDASVVYQINDNNVVLQIADELLEINITAQNGRKIILVKTFSDAIIMNNSDSGELQTFDDAPAEEAVQCEEVQEENLSKEKDLSKEEDFSREEDFSKKEDFSQEESLCKEEGILNNNYVDCFATEVNHEDTLGLKELCSSPDLTTVGDEVCIYNEEVVSSSTEIEAVPKSPTNNDSNKQEPTEIPATVDDQVDQKENAAKKSKKVKKVSWEDEKPNLNKSKCLADNLHKVITQTKSKDEEMTKSDNCDPSPNKKFTTKDSLRKIPKTKAALKFVESAFKPAKSKTSKEERVPCKTAEAPNKPTENYPAKTREIPIKRRRMSVEQNTNSKEEQNTNTNVKPALNQQPHNQDTTHNLKSNTKSEAQTKNKNRHACEVKMVEKAEAQLPKTKERNHKRDALVVQVSSRNTSATPKTEKTNHKPSKSSQAPRKKQKVEPPPKPNLEHYKTASARTHGASHVKKQKIPAQEPMLKVPRERKEKSVSMQNPKTHKELERKKGKTKLAEPTKFKEKESDLEKTEALEEKPITIQHISVQENSITSSTSQDNEAMIKERSNQLIKQITDDWDDDSDDLKFMENSSKRRLSLQEYKNRTNSVEPDLDKLDLTSDLWKDVNLLANAKNKRDVSPESPILNVKFNNKTYSRSTSLFCTKTNSSPSRLCCESKDSNFQQEEPLSSAIELHLPKINRSPSKSTTYNQEYLRNALLNDLQAVNAYTATLIKQNQPLMQRFLEQQRLTADELKKVKTIIRYKRLAQHLSTIRINEIQSTTSIRETFFPTHLKLSPNLNIEKVCDTKRQSNVNQNVSTIEVNQPQVKEPSSKTCLKKGGNVPEKRKRKRFRFLYSDEETESHVPVSSAAELPSDEPKLDKNCCLKKPRLDSGVSAMDYSVHQSNSQGQLTLVFKRSFRNDPKMQPFVKLERLPSIDLLAKNRLF